MAHRESNPPRTEVRMGISRSNHDVIHITIEDTESLAASVRIDLDFEQFAKLITGMQIRAKAEWNHVDKVGMVREMRECRIDVTGVKRPYGPAGEAVVREMYEKIKDPEWSSEVYLRSQGSFFREGERESARFNEYRWVEKP